MPNNEKPKILVVDDNASNLALAQATLEDEGYAVVIAATGEDGIRAFETENPDCVLLDIRMPGTDGFGVCSQIRALPGGAMTPIVFLTALRDVETFDRALRAGGDDFLTKPFRPTELVIRVQAALKLRRMSAELREHYDLVRRQRDDLMRLQLQKERLTAFVVHDLKNPLNSIDLHAQVLLRDPQTPQRSKDSVLNIRGAARSMLRLILNLLDISKSEDGQLSPNYRVMDLQTVVDEVLDAHKMAAESARVTLARSIEDQALSADPDLLRRILENLLDNAIRHAPENSEVRMSAVRTVSATEIRVEDAGPGIPADMKDKIFERFVRISPGDAAATRTGRGLGLTFCKLAVEAQGGSICVEDGKTTVFCVRLPNDR